MYKNSLIDSPIAIFILFIFIAIVNLFLPVHFLTILLIGITYTIFSKAIEKEYYYTLFFMIIAFSIIELSQGLKLFSLSLLAFFIHIFVAPFLKNILTSEKMIQFALVAIFYLGTMALFSFVGDIEFRMVAIFLVNLFLEIAFIWILF